MPPATHVLNIYLYPELSIIKLSDLFIKIKMKIIQKFKTENKLNHCIIKSLTTHD